MRKNVDHLPEEKRAELTRIVPIIRELCDDVEMIILFGSYARGDYRDETDLPSERKSGAASDYDILVVCQHKTAAAFPDVCPVKRLLAYRVSMDKADLQRFQFLRKFLNCVCK